MSEQSFYDTVIIGAGPAGLAVANRLQKDNINCLVVERKFIGYNISRFPVGMTFFSSRELLEIDNFALTIPDEKPNREQYMSYLFHFASKRKINIVDNTEVLSLKKANDIFKISIQQNNKSLNTSSAKTVVCACGAFDEPQQLNVPAENLSHVSHFFNEVYRYIGHSVMIVGSGNSAVEAALKLHRVGARVNVSYRKPALNSNKIKYWIYPDIEKRFTTHEIGHFPSTKVKKIEPGKLILEKTLETSNKTDRSHLKDIELQADFVLALTGYNPPIAFLKDMGIQINDLNYVPTYNPDTLETNVEGLFIAGVITGGNISGKVFIENSRHHGDLIVGQIHKILKEG
ncbi:MAG: NAD(P)-binding domain-containing protein [Spirochaetia bacterium]|nr:NAD(P)-binding domain-containing protein [Spirochaetia bacterium]